LHSRSTENEAQGNGRLIEDLEARRVDALISYDLDRLARDPRDLEDLIDLKEALGCQVRSVTGSLRLDSDADVTMARVMVWRRN
jgi:DNA invertase Pin-like site-specific DNA recombinase